MEAKSHWVVKYLTNDRRFGKAVFESKEDAARFARSVGEIPPDKPSRVQFGTHGNNGR